MVKLKTFNNFICKRIIGHAVHGNSRAVYLSIYNHRDLFTEELFARLFNLCHEIAPIDLELFKTLPNDVKNYYNQLWLNSCSSNSKTNKTNKL